MELNYIAIIITTVIAVVLGMGWFGFVFGKLWAEIVGTKDPSLMTLEENKEFQKKMAPVYVVNIVMTFIMMGVLYFFSKGFPEMSPLSITFLAWLGFVVPLEASQSLWSGKSRRHAWQMFLLTCGYQLLCFVIAGAIYTAMK
jgi:hypothetical protein